jgi:hypothetical protein
VSRQPLSLFYLSQNSKPKSLDHNLHLDQLQKGLHFSIVHYKFIAFNCCKVKIIIPPFGILIKRIKIASFKIHLARKQKEEEEMRAYKKYQAKSNTPKFLPVIPLVKIELPINKKDKSSYITFELKIRAGTGAGSPSYKKFMNTFEEGSPQEWMDVLTGLKEIWTQNSVTEPTDRAATVAAILKGDSLTAFDAALEDARNPEDGIGVNALLEMTEEHVEVALRAVTEIVFPFRALETQKQWMNRHFKKPFDLEIKKTAAALSRINNYLPLFPLGNPESKFSEAEMVSLLDFSLPAHWRKIMDLKGYVVADNDYKSLVEECQRIERNNTVARYEEVDDDDDNKNNKKVKFAKNQNNNKKNGDEEVRDADGLYFCKLCKKNPSHPTSRCFKLKPGFKDREQGKPKGKPYSNRTFRKEVNAITRRAEKHGGLKIVESALKREQGKTAGRASKKHAKKTVAKKTAPDDDTSSDESMHNMEMRIPRKKRPSPKTVRINSRAEVVDIEDSDDDRKMPAKSNKKKAKTAAIGTMETDSSSDEEPDSDPNKEERAFLRSIAYMSEDSKSE